MTSPDALAPAASPATPEPAVHHPYVPDEILVRFTDAPSTSEARARLGLDVVSAARPLRLFARSSSNGRLFLARLSRGMTVERAMQAFASRPGVASVQPNYLHHALSVDPDLPLQWGLANTGQPGLRGPLAPLAGADIHWQEAWNLIDNVPPGADTVVAVIDTGIDLAHPDLAPVLWTNPLEIPANGIDDDDNGYIDDVHGYDFAYNDAVPADGDGHGTHVSGTIAAASDNGLGVAGVARRRVKIMACKFLDDTGSGSTADAIEAIHYAVSNGARVLNNSWGGGPYEQGLYDAIAAANQAGVTFVAAAGNEGTNNDLIPFYPSSYALPNVISVAASDRRDRLAYFSNWGLTTVDLAAPGEEIYSTLPGGLYGWPGPGGEGTSAAAAHVSGALAVVDAIGPPATPAEAIDRLLRAVDPSPAFAGKMTSEGRLNLENIVERGLGLDPVPPAPILDLLVLQTTFDSTTLRFTASGDDGATGRANRYELAFAPTPEWVDYASATKRSGGWAPAPAGQRDTITLSGLEPATAYTFQLSAIDNAGNAALSNVVTATTTAPALVFHDTVESGTQGWTVQSNQPQSIWQPTNLLSHSPSHSWTDSPSGNYRNNLDSRLISPPIDLTAAGAAHLIFWQRYDLEAGTDFGSVEASSDGLQWRRIGSVTGTDLQWRRAAMDLTAFVGDVCWVRIRLQTNPSGQGDGWYIDDIEVVIEPPGTTIVQPQVPGGWTLENDWGLESASYLSDSPGANYDPSQLSAATLANPIDLSHYSRANLSFDLDTDLQDPNDELYLEMSTDAIHWQPVGRYTGTRTWAKEGFDLSKVAGYPSVGLRFVLSSDAAVERSGVRIDQLKVDAVPMADSDGDGIPDESDAFPCDPKAATVVHSPGEGEHGILMFEDLWPQNGDLDFNDATVAYNYIIVVDADGRVTSLDLMVNALSVGSVLSNELMLRLPVPSGAALDISREFENGDVEPLAPAPDEGELVIPMTGALDSLFPDLVPPINTTDTVLSVPSAALRVRIRFETPQAIDLAQAPFDLFLARAGDRGHQIHRPQYAGTDTMNTSLFGTGDDASTPARHFVNHQGIPFALNVPAVTLWPKESVRIDQAYPDIVGFGASGGEQHQDWYQSNVVLPLLWTGGANGTPRPDPRIFGALPGRCDDGNVCTDDSCGPLGQCVSQPVDGRVCDDHDTCTTSSSCVGPLCAPGPLRDADGDGHVAAGCGGDDCDDGNPSVTDIPHEILGLGFSDPSTLGWIGAGVGTLYAVLRGDVRALPVGSSPTEVCLTPATPDLTAVDPTPPAPSRGFWYLVRGQNSCGAGPYGNSSNGLPRTSTACP